MEIKKLYPEGREKALTLSYDDGIFQDIRLVELLNRFGVKATFNLNSGVVPGVEWYCWTYRGAESRRMDLRKVGNLYDGHEVAVHTVTHPDLTKMEPRVLYEEIWNDRVSLESLFSCRISGMALPFGAWNEKVLEAVQKLGFAYCRTVESTHDFRLPDRLPMLDPTCHHDDPALFDLADSFLKTEDELALFYLWGHSYEFDGNHNWDRMEKFLEKTAGKSEIWYAVNADVIAYLCAMDRLVLGEDFALNPTDLSLWIRADGAVREIPARTMLRF